MIKRKSFSIFKISKYYIVLLVMISLISLVQLHKRNLTETERTFDGDNLYTENNIINDGSLIYLDETYFIILSESDNTIQYFNWDGDFLKSLSLSSYTSVDITYMSATKEFYGYYYRSQSWFTIREDNNIVFSDNPTFTGEFTKSKCYDFEFETYCITKNLFGTAKIENLNGEVVILDNNRIHYQISYSIGLVFLPFALILFFNKNRNKKSEK